MAVALLAVLLTACKPDVPARSAGDTSETSDTSDTSDTGPSSPPDSALDSATAGEQDWATDACPALGFDLVGSWDASALGVPDAVTDRDPGLGVVDVDADGDEDVLYGWAGGTHLLLNDGAGALIPSAWVVGGRTAPPSRAIAAADLDADGDEDVVLGFDAPDEGRFLWNDGRLRFHTEPLRGANNTSWSLSLADFDGNGWTDVYAATYAAPFDFAYITAGGVEGTGHAFWFHPAEGGWFYRPVPAAVDAALSLQGMVVDADMDGALDVYMINDFGPYVLPNQLLRNASPGVFEVDGDCSCQISSYAMGGSVADVNGDAAPDLLSTNIGWMSLLINDGSGAFYDAGRSRLRFTPAPDRMTSWAARFVDLDLDGDEDLVVAFGALGPNGSPAIGAIAGTDPAWTELDAQVTTLFVNDGEGNFAPLPESALGEVGRARTVATVDLDGDEAPDLLVAGRERLQAWRNRGGCGNGVVVDLVGPPGDSSAIGVKVRSKVRGRWRTQWVLPSVTGGQATRRVFVGMGDATRVEQLDVVWRDGRRTSLNAVAPGHVTVRHDGSVRRR